MKNNLKKLKSLKSSKSITYVTKEKLGLYGAEYVGIIKELAKINVEKNIRICFHEDKDSNLHQMLIYERRNMYYPPHVHKKRDEIHYVYDGELELHTLDSQGYRINSNINKENSNSFSLFTANCYHLTRPRYNYVIYLEIKNGPLSNFEEECIEPKLLNSMTRMQYMDYCSKLLE